MSSLILQADRWRFFVSAGLWPKKGNFDPAAWVSNFSKDERPLAIRLIEGFSFYSDELVRQMFRSAFCGLSSHVLNLPTGITNARHQWAGFSDSALFVRVTGENPNDTDSGYLFARMCREVLGIDQDRIVTPEDCLVRFVSGRARDVVFVDDFVGSGDQFINSWFRRYPTSEGVLSFFEVDRVYRGRFRFFYCPVICTSYGQNEIKKQCPSVLVNAAHFFNERQSVLSGESDIWRDDMRTEGPEFVREASQRAGIPDKNGDVGCWRGYKKLGLALAFSHGWPDATIPLFSWDKNDWSPLLTKGAL